MEAQVLISQTKQNLARIQSDKFEKLPTVKRFFKWVKAEDRKYVFQDVVLTHLEQGKDTAKNARDVWVKLESEAVQSQLENDSSAASKFSSIISNTEGWKNSDTNNKFGIEAITSWCEHFQVHLKQAGFNGTYS